MIHNVAIYFMRYYLIGCIHFLNKYVAESRFIHLILIAVDEAEKQKLKLFYEGGHIIT